MINCMIMLFYPHYKNMLKEIGRKKMVKTE